MDKYSNTVNWFFGKAREFFGPEPGALVPLNILAAFFAHEHSDASMRILHGYTSIGLVIGIWADKFDHMATVTNFIIVPLSFLSGTFYSIDKLPEILRIISNYNPFFHMIDGFRYSFIGQLDGSLSFGILLLTFLSLLITYFCAIKIVKLYEIS